MRISSKKVMNIFNECKKILPNIDIWHAINWTLYITNGIGGQIIDFKRNKDIYKYLSELCK